MPSAREGEYKGRRIKLFLQIFGRRLELVVVGGAAEHRANSISYNTLFCATAALPPPGYATKTISENHYDIAAQVLMLFADSFSSQKEML